MTIREIAEKAGVSIATVSLALNGKGTVKEETKKIILALAKEGGYIKKNIKSKKPILVAKYIESGVSIMKNGSFITELVDAVESIASQYSYNIVIKNITKDGFDTDIEGITADEFSGIIFLATEANEYAAQKLIDLDIPIVALDNMYEYMDIDAVVMDNRGGIYDAVNYLYHLGHREIGYIDGDIIFDNLVQRKEGYEKALSKLGLEKKEEYILSAGLTVESAYEDMCRKLETKIKLPTAYVAANDVIAIGAIRALKEIGVLIPEQVSVVGFDDIPYCMGLDKPLTTMRVDRNKLGEYAMTMLLYKIKEGNDVNIENKKVVLRTQLVERESTMIRG